MPGVRPLTRRQAPPMTPQHGCAGLCAGEGCAQCTSLADQITRAKRLPNGPQRDAHLLDLADRVADAMDPARSVAPPLGPAVRLVGKPTYRNGHDRG
ncbi:hypothetical protein GCM10022254_09170 [Actinomadura meridiana]|uniref:Uncharacterized protein n=1 Tax=Actinomadura meridiana TaxID=559626 RepID=A0ABP8BTM1_9ACTN